MEKFVKRVTAPDLKNTFYYSKENIFYASNYSMLPASSGGNKANILGGNCTAYVYGRLLEQGVKYSKLCGNAGNWFAQAKAANYPTGTTPKLGSVACWDDHVAIVESIVNYTISESGWNSYIFRTRNLDANWTRTGHKFLGFIYTGIDYEPEVIETIANVNLKAGAQVTLNNTPCYSSASSTSYGVKSGTYYLWDDTVNNGRIRITNAASRVGVAGQVTCWVAVADIGLSTGSSNTSTTPSTSSTVKKALTETSYSDYAKGSSKYYYVQKKFKDWSTSKGAFSVWKNAYNTYVANKASGYHVYDCDGKQLD